MYKNKNGRLKHSLETRQKMSKNHKDVRKENNPMFDISPWNKGKTQKELPQLICSQETRKKISNSLKGKPSSNKGKKLSEEVRQKIRNTLLGRKLSEETKRKISKTRTGQKHSEKTRKKMSESALGKPATTKGKIWSKEQKMHLSNSLIGHEVSKITREKISKTKKDRKSSKGKNNPNWRGGISFISYTEKFNNEFKELIRKRDDYHCQLCGCPETENLKKLDVHHIDYDKQNCLPSNLVSLCRSCHSKTQFYRLKWKKYFKNKTQKIVIPKKGSKQLEEKINA